MNGVAETVTFNPLTYDTENLIALYDGDVGLTTSAWNDQSINGYDLTLFDTPTVVDNALNGHDAVQFDGISEYGRIQDTPTLTQPFTIYFVMKQITWVSLKRIFGDATSTGLYISKGSGTGNIRMYAGTALESNPDLTLDTYGIATCVFNGATSENRTNNSATVSGNAGTTNAAGFVLCSNNTGTSGFSKTEFAYLIIRQGADNTETQDKFIGYLKDRFGL